MTRQPCAGSDHGGFGTPAICSNPVVIEHIFAPATIDRALTEVA